MYEPQWHWCSCSFEAGYQTVSITVFLSLYNCHCINRCYVVKTSLNTWRDDFPSRNKTASIGQVYVRQVCMIIIIKKNRAAESNACTRECESNFFHLLDIYKQTLFSAKNSRSILVLVFLRLQMFSSCSTSIADECNCLLNGFLSNLFTEMCFRQRWTWWWQHMLQWTSHYHTWGLAHRWLPSGLSGKCSRAKNKEWT